MPRSTAERLRAIGHFAIDVRDLGFGAASDDIIASYARENGLAILTRDFDYADIRNYPPQQYSGILVVSLPNESTAPVILETVERAIGEVARMPSVSGALVIVEPSRLRIRRVD